jgi:biotin carboxyl carrier protein
MESVTVTARDADDDTEKEHEADDVGVVVNVTEIDFAAVDVGLERCVGVTVGSGVGVAVGSSDTLGHVVETVTPVVSLFEIDQVEDEVNDVEARIVWDVLGDDDTLCTGDSLGDIEIDLVLEPRVADKLDETDHVPPSLDSERERDRESVKEVDVEHCDVGEGPVRDVVLVGAWYAVRVPMVGEVVSRAVREGEAVSEGPSIVNDTERVALRDGDHDVLPETSTEPEMVLDDDFDVVIEALAAEENVEDNDVVGIPCDWDGVSEVARETLCVLDAYRASLVNDDNIVEEPCENVSEFVFFSEIDGEADSDRVWDVENVVDVDVVTSFVELLPVAVHCALEENVGLNE